MLKGSGFTGAPARAAMSAAAASACWQAIPPCLTGNDGDVARRIDVRDAPHARVGVDRQEAVRVGRQPGERGALEARQA